MRSEWAEPDDSSDDEQVHKFKIDESGIGFKQKNA